MACALDAVFIVSAWCLVCQGSDVGGLCVAWGGKHGVGLVHLRLKQPPRLVQPQLCQCPTGWEDSSTRVTSTCVVWCSWSSKSSFLPPPSRHFPCGLRAAGFWVETPKSLLGSLCKGVGVWGCGGLFDHGCMRCGSSRLIALRH